MSAIRHLFGKTGLPIIAAAICIAGALCIDGSFGPSSFFHRSVHWVDVDPDARRLPPEIKLALLPTPPPAIAGPFEWRQTVPGFEIAEMPVIANDRIVDHVLLSRVDPARFRIVTRNAPTSNRSPKDWLRDLGAVFVINGSYYGPDGRPATPFISDGVPLGPVDYQAQEGAFTVRDGDVEIHDLAHQDWHAAFDGAKDALVSYPLLLTADPTHFIKHSRWLAGRSFVAKDQKGYVIFGTSTGGYFSLDRLAVFLRAAPLHLTAALNLDGGLVACQAITFPDFRRDVCSDWEIQESQNGKVKLLQWPWGGYRGLPIVIAVVPK